MSSPLAWREGSPDMTRWITRRAFLASTGGAALALALPRAARADSPPLNFGFQNTSWGSVAMVAEAEKTFEKAGAKVKPFRFDGGKSTRDAMIAGRVDIGVLGAAPFVVGAAKGDIVAIAVAMYAGRTNAVVAAKDSGIRSVADLKGRRVASQLGSSTDYVFQNKILPKFGLAKGDVQIANIPHQNEIAAMVGKSVDAFAGVEPFPSVAEIEGLGTVLVDYGEFDLQPVFVAINRPVLESRRGDVVAFLRGWLAAVRIVNENPKRAVEIVWNEFKAQGYDVKEAAFTRMLAKLDVKPEFTPALRDYLNEQGRVLLGQKQIPAVPDWNRALDESVLAEAKKA
jgi:aliphatic sulfonates family ABC transporter substrate-binding protein